MPVPGSSSERGYGAAHKRLRTKWNRVVQQGGAVCWRCGLAIQAGTEWVLGHQDGSGKRLYRGPEHRECSDRSGPAQQQARDPDPRPRTRW